MGKDKERKAKARADGEGSLFQRKDGAWIAQVAAQNPDGSRKIVQRVRQTQGDARRALTDLKSKQDSHRLVVTGKATVRDWLNTWLEEFIRPNRAPRTYTSYYNVLRLHLSDKIGKLPLAKLAAEDVQRQLNYVASTQEHGRTADLLRAVLRSAFNKAVKLRRMDMNPVLGTDPVNYTPQETATLSADEAIRFLEAAEHDRLGALFIIALSLGLRKGEAIGLKPEDVDLDRRMIYVRRSLQWVKLPDEKQGHWNERPPKRNSKRSLPMTESIYRAVVRHIARRLEDAAKVKAWKGCGYLFTSVTGAPLHERNVSEAFYALCGRAKVPAIRFHDTRHSCGTLLHVQGADPFIIQTVLGHSQLSTTRRYTHVPVEVTKAAVTGLESLFEVTRDKRKAEEEKKRAAAEQVPAERVPTQQVQ
jgi:integrase